jgi:hypothetical protein
VSAGGGNGLQLQAAQTEAEVYPAPGYSSGEAALLSTLFGEVRPFRSTYIPHVYVHVHVLHDESWQQEWVSVSCISIESPVCAHAGYASAAMGALLLQQQPWRTVRCLCPWCASEHSIDNNTSMVRQQAFLATCGMQAADASCSGTAAMEYQLATPSVAALQSALQMAATALVYHRRLAHGVTQLQLMIKVGGTAWVG